jgi:hypothetical protein
MKLSAKVLKQLVQEEVKKFGEPEDLKKKAKETEEVDADGYADTLEKHIDMMKALKIEESKCKARLAKIQERKIQLAKLIAK